MRGIAICLGAVLALPLPAITAEDRWVEVTRPMLAYDAGHEDPLLRRQFLDFLASMPEAAPLPSKCGRTLQVGEKYILGGAQTHADTHLLVTLRDVVCPGENGPQNLVYAPPRRIVGAYLRPIRDPGDDCPGAAVQPNA